MARNELGRLEPVSRRIAQFLAKLNARPRANDDPEKAARRMAREANRRAAPFQRKYKFPLSLPNNICSLDIETEGIRKNSPEKTKLIVAGTITYRWDRNRYVPGEYRPFYPENITTLAQYLRNLDGIIIGHNIFAFDYAVLNSLTPMVELITKTVDTFYFLWTKTGRRTGGKSLRNLAELNLQRNKLDLSGKVHELWRAGQKTRIIRYNARDCRLTMDLWLALVTYRNICLSVERGGQMLKIGAADLPVLLGKSPILTKREWNKRVRNKLGLGAQSAQPYFEVIDSQLKQSDQPICIRMQCRACVRYFIFTTRNGRQFGRDEKIVCPGCGLKRPPESAWPLYRVKRKGKNKGQPIPERHGTCLDGVVCEKCRCAYVLNDRSSNVANIKRERCPHCASILRKPKPDDFIRERGIVKGSYGHIAFFGDPGTLVGDEWYVDIEAARAFIKRRARLHWERWMPIGDDRSRRFDRITSF